MARKDIRTTDDPGLIKGLVDSGSLGKGFKDISTENTASLGLKTPAAQISSSLSEVLDEDNITSPLQTSLQYVVAKTFETRDNTSLSFFSGSQAFATSRANKDTILEQQNSINSISVVTASYAAASASLSTRVTANDAKVSMVIGTRSTEAKAGNTTTISTSQASAITANTAKTGISTAQANAITANTAKVSTGEDLIPGTELGKLIASVAESRGTYTLTFTFTTADGRTTKTANITMS